jgi:hypothetical protein
MFRSRAPTTVLLRSNASNRDICTDGDVSYKLVLRKQVSFLRFEIAIRVGIAKVALRPIMGYKHQAALEETHHVQHHPFASLHRLVLRL